jgi:transcriptional regulator with XRE-family HTH domain
MESDEQLLDRVKKALAGRYLTFVAEQTGLHYNTIWKIVNGKTNPSRATLEKLSTHLFG